MTTKIELHDDAQTIEIRIGSASASVPFDQIDTVVRALQWASTLVPSGTTTRSAAAKVVTSSAPATAARVAPRAPAPPLKQPATKKRRSRKRVGDALVGWMRDNPGWHSEEALLEIVITHKMTDASPKRALKIALGKQRDEVFEGDGNGFWKLVEDKAAGTPPKPKPKTRKKPGRKPKVTLAASRGRRQKRLKTKRVGASTDDEVSPAPAEEEAAPSRTVLVKRGQDRRTASLPPGELEAREQASRNVDSRRRRWSSAATREQMEKARKNLLGDPPA